MIKRSTKAFMVGVFLTALMGYAGAGHAEVNVNIGIGLPPVVIPAPPPVVLVPSSYVYFVPDVSVDIFFHHGYWYRPHHGRYYRATSYNGPWVVLAPKAVPKAVRYVPADFRRVPPGHQKIQHADLMKHWDTWEKEKHWDKQGHAKQAKGGHGGNGGAKEGNGGGKGDYKQGKSGGKGKNKD